MGESVLMKRRILVLLAAIATAVPSISYGFRPAEQNDRFEIRLPEFDLVGHQTAATETGKRQTVDQLAERVGGRWAVYAWNPQTLTPTAIIGSGFETAQRVTTDEAAEGLARTVIFDNQGALGVFEPELRVRNIGRGQGKVGVHFVQLYQGIEVLNTQANALFTEEGRLYGMGADIYGDIAVDPTPTLPASVAQEVARQAIPFDPATDSIEGDAELFVLPMPRAVDSVEHHLVWRVQVNTERPLGEWVTHVDAHTGEILWRYNDIHFLGGDFSGTGESNPQEDTRCNGETTQPFSYANVAIAGVGTAVTDQNGDWFQAFGGSASASLSVGLAGPYCNVNVAGAPPDANIGAVISTGVPFPIVFDDSNSRQDERDVFDGVNDVHDFMETIDPGFFYWNNTMTAIVNEPPTCNAYWNGQIHFYPEGGGCANTGEIQGVVHHEFGHGVQNAVIGSQGSQGLGEGNSDVLANLITQESVIGRGFFLSSCTSGIRDSDNTLKYPGDVIGQGNHNAGRVIAGFHWDFMLMMQSVYGTELGTQKAAEIWHFGRKVSNPGTQPLQVLRSFEADDDDANLANGTPHYDFLCEAAMAHGFTCPTVTQGIFITHFPVPTQTSSGDVTVSADIVSTESPLNTVVLRYSINGGAEQNVNMTNTGGDTYEADIPGLASPDEVEYWIDVAALDGSMKTEPTFAPIRKHAFDLAIEYADMETVAGWVVDPDGTDDAGSNEDWENVDPNGTPIAPEDDTTPAPGVKCWVTGQAPVGGAAGANALVLGTTTLQSPVFDITGATTALVKYNKWYRNDGGVNPNTEVWVVRARNNGGPWVDVENTLVNTDGWETFSADLLALFGGPVGSVQFRFIASDLPPASIVDASLDDFRILGELNTADAPDLSDPTPRYALYSSRPNPAFGQASIAFQVPARTRVDMRLFDVSGREVANLANGEFEAGVHNIEWDGRDARGNLVPSGVYFYRLNTGEYQATRQLVFSH